MCFIQAQNVLKLMAAGDSETSLLDLGKRTPERKRE